MIESRAFAEEPHLLPADMPRTGVAERADAAEHAAIAPQRLRRRGAEAEAEKERAAKRAAVGADETAAVNLIFIGIRYGKEDIEVKARQGADPLADMQSDV